LLSRTEERMKKIVVKFVSGVLAAVGYKTALGIPPEVSMVLVETLVEDYIDRQVRYGVERFEAAQRQKAN
jgi:hypothetical protein